MSPTAPTPQRADLAWFASAPQQDRTWHVYARAADGRRKIVASFRDPAAAVARMNRQVGVWRDAGHDVRLLESGAFVALSDSRVVAAISVEGCALAECTACDPVALLGRRTVAVRTVR